MGVSDDAQVDNPELSVLVVYGGDRRVVRRKDMHAVIPLSRTNRCINGDKVAKHDAVLLLIHQTLKQCRPPCERRLSQGGPSASHGLSKPSGTRREFWRGGGNLCHASFQAHLGLPQLS